MWQKYSPSSKETFDAFYTQVVSVEQNDSQHTQHFYKLCNGFMHTDPVTLRHRFATLCCSIYRTSVADLTNRSLSFVFMYPNLVRKLFRKFQGVNLQLYFQRAPTQIDTVARPLQNVTLLICYTFGNTRVLNAIQLKTKVNFKSFVT